MKFALKGLLTLLVRTLRFIAVGLPKRLFRAIPPGARQAVALSVVAVGLLGAFGHSTLTRVPPGFVGVRQQNWGAGIEARDYATGIYFGVRGLVSWHLLDKRTHVAHFTKAKVSPLDADPLEIRTKDNNSIRIELSVTYRIRRGEAHRLVERGWEFSYRNHAHSIVKNELRKELATLSSEDWFDPQTKIEKMASIRPRLRSAFADVHLDCLNVQIHGVAYPPSYQKKLQETQIQYQKAKLFEISRAVEGEEALVETYREATASLVATRRAELENELQAERMQSRLEVQRIETRARRYQSDSIAGADAEYELLVSAGQLAFDRAKADGEKARLDAMSGVGGRLLLARDAAQGLNLKSVTLDSSQSQVVELLDLDRLVDRLIGDSESPTAPR